MRLHALIWPWLPFVIRTVYRLDVDGQEHVPRRGGLLVVANHLSAFDPFVLSAAVGRPLHYMAKAELWRYRPLGWAMDELGGFPVGRGRGDREAVETGARLLREGKAVGMFPGGYVRREGPWFRGAAKMALATGTPVLPVRLFDTDKAVAGRRVGFPALRARIGPPIPVEAGPATVAAAKGLTEQFRAAVDDLSA